MYYNDMYVDRLLSEEAARQSSKAFKVWATSEYEHNGLRADGEKLLGRLFGMVRGEDLDHAIVFHSTCSIGE